MHLKSHSTLTHFETLSKRSKEAWERNYQIKNDSKAQEEVTERETSSSFITITINLFLDDRGFHSVSVQVLVELLQSSFSLSLLLSHPQERNSRARDLLTSRLVLSLSYSWRWWWWKGWIKKFPHDWHWIPYTLGRTPSVSSFFFLLHLFSSVGNKKE